MEQIKGIPLNLQMFAVSPLNTTGDGALAPEMKTYYERTLLERLLPELVHAQFGMKTTIPKNNGKGAEWRRFASLPQASFALTEGVTPNGQNITVAAITASVTQHGNFVVITDQLELTSYDRVLDQAAELLGEQAGYYVDTLVRDVIVAGTNVLYAWKSKFNTDSQLVRDTSVAAPTARNQITNLHAMSIDTIRTAKRIMQRNLVKPFKGDKTGENMSRGEFVMVTHPDAIYDIENDKKWLDVRHYQDKEAVYTGEVGKAYGVRFVMSEIAKTWAAAGALNGAGPAKYAVYGAIMLGHGAFGILDIAGSGNVEYIVKPRGSSGSEDPLNQRGTSAWKVMFTTKILQDLAILRIEHGFTDDLGT